MAQVRAAIHPAHPLHAMLLAFPVPLFLGALLSDWAYSASYQVQWINFASWLIAGALLFTAFALLWSGIDALRADNRRRSKWLPVALLAATFVVGFVDALVHAKDGWATMPEGVVLSILVTVLAIAAAWVGLARSPAGDVE